MNEGIASIIADLQEAVSGEPWYGRSFLSTVKDVDRENIYRHPNARSHSMAELLYHMITWAEYTRYGLERKQEEMKEAEAMDWRMINPAEHTWEKGMAQFTACTDAIVELLKSADEKMLDEKVDDKKYNSRALINGLIQHTIYHTGQIAYVNKLLQ